MLDFKTKYFAKSPKLVKGRNKLQRVKETLNQLRRSGICLFGNENGQRYILLSRLPSHTRSSS